MFIIFGVVYLITAIVYILVRNVQRDGKCLKVTWIVDIAYFFGGIFYYVGRNLLYLIQLPQDSLAGVLTAAFFLLGMVVVFYRLIPFFISKYYQSNLAKEHKTTEAKLQLVPEWILAAESLTWLVEFDAWYAVVGNNLAASSSAAVWVLWALFIFMYMGILYYLVNIQYGKCNVNVSCVTSNIIVTILGINFGFYLLANNPFPLFYYSNTINVPVAWIVIKALVLIVVIAAIALLMVYRCLSKTLQEKLLPHALYEHLGPDSEKQPFARD